MKTQNLYNPFKEHKFSNAICSISGKALTSPKDALTVWPKWIMKEYGLGEKKQTMLDDSSKNLDEFVIPCSPGIKSMFEAIDHKVEKAFADGIDAIQAIGNETWCVWFGRIFYGYLYHEVIAVLGNDRPDAYVGEALNEKFTSWFELFRGLLMGARPEGFEVCSVFKFKVDTTRTEENFEFRDELKTQNFTLRLGEIGIIISFLDQGLLEETFENLSIKTSSQILHPAQFNEWEANVYYGAYLIGETPIYSVVSEGDESIIKRSERKASKRTILMDWEGKMFSQVLEAVWKKFGVPKNTIFHEPDEVKSYLLDRNGDFITIDKLDHE
ncbi:MAG: hypothetical protein ACJATA_000915 [Sphingobacteriales bacterium]|jgi:hypothetical protein